MQECVEILVNEKRGVLSVNGDSGYPYGMPMNHFYNSDDGSIYFHCGKAGHRLDSLRNDCKASFCVIDSGTASEGSWALNFKSVIVFGDITVIDDTETVIEISEKLSRKFTDDEEYIKSEIEQYARATLLLKLEPKHICGKAVTES